jgi:flagellar biosynthesis/type III secretory pathway chaperone
MQHPSTNQLDLVEQQFRQVAAFLASGDAPRLQSASQTLQTLSAELARQLQATAVSHTSAEQQKSVRRRVQAMAQRMQSLRDNLSRQAAYTQQALQVVVPTPAKSTYSGGGSVYGSVARQVSVHKYVAA